MVDIVTQIKRTATQINVVVKNVVFKNTKECKFCSHLNPNRHLFVSKPCKIWYNQSLKLNQIKLHNIKIDRMLY